MHPEPVDKWFVPFVQHVEGIDEGFGQRDSLYFIEAQGYHSHLYRIDFPGASEQDGICNLENRQT
jgi:hypothetical protein